MKRSAGSARQTPASSGSRASPSRARACAARWPGGRRFGQAARRFPSSMRRRAMRSAAASTPSRPPTSARRCASRCFGRVTTGGCWTVGGAAAAVGVTRVGLARSLVAVGSAGGVLPRWPLLVIAAIVPVPRSPRSLARVSRCRAARPAAAAFRSLASSPRDLAIVSGWALAGAAAKVVAATAVVAAIGIDNPIRAALVLVPAVELAAILPLTPGNVGIASAAVALALGSQGVDSPHRALRRHRVRGRRAPHGGGGRCRRRAGTRGPVGAAVRAHRRRRCRARAWRRSPSGRPCCCRPSESRRVDRALLQEARQLGVVAARRCRRRCAPSSRATA